MNKFCDWWKENRRLPTFMKAVIFALLPVICCLIYCGVQGGRIRDIYLPSSDWNDELFYYKQVEGVLNYGYPLGYFGYNESHALKLSFAAWSPVLMLPWVIWGLLFGWNLMSPVICNIVLMSLACFLFVLLVRPNWKQITVLTLLFCLYTPFIRYMLSGMTESACFSILIIFYALAIHYFQKKRGIKLFLLFLLSGIMTLMRPYLVLFLLLPAFVWFREGKDRGSRLRRIIVLFIFLTIILGIYACINHYLGAEYFGPLFFTDWISTFFTQGFFSGVYHVLRRLYSGGREYIAHVLEAFRSGLLAGTFYASFLVCTVVILLRCIQDWRKRLLLRRMGEKPEKEKPFSEQRLSEEHRLILEVHLLFSSVMMLLALLLMYKFPEGSRHLSIFIAADIFVIVSLIDSGFCKKTIFIALIFTYFYVYMTHYQLPFVKEERLASIEVWQETLSGKLPLNLEKKPSYENVVIWVVGDIVGDQFVGTSWQLLYALPKGMGISCCMYDYVMENFDSLQSKYIYVVQGGDIEEKCIQAEYTKLIQGEGMVLYVRQ